jgi:hypothetical protein
VYTTVFIIAGAIIIAALATIIAMKKLDEKTIKWEPFTDKMRGKLEEEKDRQEWLARHPIKKTQPEDNSLEANQPQNNQQ